MDHRVDPRLQSFIPSPTSQSSLHGGVAQAGSQLPYYSIAPNPDQTANPAHDAGLDANGNDLKRPRACESCRSLKVKCEFDDNAPDAPCKRCAKARRKCIITAPTRRRQKKADSRVAELEKKIDALTATLRATRSAAVDGSESEYSDEGDDSPESRTVRTSSGGPVILDSPVDESLVDASLDGRMFAQRAGHKRRRSDGPRRSSDHSISPHQIKSSDTPVPEDPSTVYSFLVPKGSAPRQNSIPTPDSLASTYNGNDYSDVIDRKLISSQAATAVFNRYVNEMCPIFPLVTFKPGTAASDVRKSKPILFLAILAAGSGILHSDLQRSLTKEVSKVFAERILVNGEKSIEMIQALQVSVAWYWPPENYEELKFYQMTHIAATMAIDIGINHKNRPNQHKLLHLPRWKEQQWKKGNPDSIEARKAWLSCYYLCSATAMSLRRPRFVHWTPYMDECIEQIEKAADSTMADKSFCSLVRMQRIADEVGTEFGMDDPFAPVSLSDPKTQYALKGFEQQIENWRTSCASLTEQAFLSMNEQVIIMYVHEIAMHTDHNVEDFQAPFITDKVANKANKPPELLSTAHINALVAVFTAAHKLVDTFLGLEMDFVRALPVFQFVRLSYAMVALIKMYFASSVADSDVSKVLPKEDIKVGYYLDRLIDRYKEAATDDHCRPAQKFSMILKMLKQWYLRGAGIKPSDIPVACWAAQNPGRPGGQDDAQYSNVRGTPLPSGDTPSASLEFGKATTPLHLLSEVASTGVTEPSAYEATAGVTSNSSAGTSSTPWYSMPMDGISGSALPGAATSTTVGDYGPIQNSFLGAFSTAIDGINPEMNFGLPSDMGMIDFNQVDEGIMNTIFEGFPNFN